jgi:hypothetical protein
LQSPRIQNHEACNEIEYRDCRNARGENVPLPVAFAARPDEDRIGEEEKERRHDPGLLRPECGRIEKQDRADRPPIGGAVSASGELRGMTPA